MCIYVYCIAICHSQDLETTRSAQQQMMDKEIVANVPNGILLNYNKDKIFPFATTLLGSCVRNKSERERQLPDIIYD